MPPHTVPHAARQASLICAVTMLAVATVFMTQPIFSEIAASFHIDITQARHPFSAASLAYSAAFFLLGPAADRFDLPRMALVGLITLALTIFIAAQTENFGIFVFAMGATGFCAALIPASMFPYMATIAPVEKQSIYVGLIVASATVGIVFSRVLTGVLTADLGWRSAFRIVVVLLLALATATRLHLVRPQQTREKAHTALTTLYLNALRLIVSPKTMPLLLVGFCLFFGFLGVVTFLTYRLVAPPFNFTAGEVGWISFAGVTALIAPFAGTIARRVGVYRTLIGGLITCLLGFLAMGAAPSTILTATGMLLLFLGVYSCQPLIFLLMVRHAPKESTGSASSLYLLFCIGGGSVSSMLLGPVWRAFGWNGVLLAGSASLLVSLAVIAAIAGKRA